MAIFQVDYFSDSLRRSTCFHLVLPNDMPPMMTKDNEHHKRKIKTLFLLHGYSGASKDWLLGASVQELAGKYNIAVIMPSCENSFYLDGKGTGRAYGTYVGQELVEYVRRTFGLAMEKEDTFIGGLSMGGFGAIRTGAFYPETFGKIVGLSSALIINNIKNKKEGFTDYIADFDYYVSVFGDLDKLDNSVNNPEYIIKKLIDGNKAVPPIYMACGTEDFLIEENRGFYDFLKSKAVEVEYVEGPGNHNWDFWDKYLEPSIQWLLK